MKQKFLTLLGSGVVYGITSIGDTPALAQVARMIAGGIQIIQLRHKEATTSEIVAEFKEISFLCKKAGVVFLVNDDCQLALDIAADGVHLGQEDISPEKARAILGESAIIGLSTHNPKEAKAALQEPIDYIGVGPMFETKTKDFETIAGLDYLEFCVDKISLPLVCIGGIIEGNLGQLVSRGAKAVALIGEIQRAPDLREKVALLESVLKNH
ncbi:MAG: thiamine phosphate synthase [SAR324 cluster bacterium]|nr:thiamine phosphate synthase [SAR324 cluster bacterium]